MDENYRCKAVSVYKPIKDYAGRIESESDDNRYYWFDRNCSDWIGGFYSRLKDCLEGYAGSIFVYDRLTGKGYDVCTIIR